MKQNLNEIVSVILQNIEEAPEKYRTEARMRAWLVDIGYRRKDVDAALKLCRRQISRANERLTRRSGALRHLSPVENYKLTSEARAALTRLEVYELMDPYERELLLERLLQFEGEVGIEDLDYLVSWILCSTRNHESQQTIYNILEDNRQAMH